jgi:hypothetical protein
MFNAQSKQFAGAFAWSRRAPITFVMSVHVYVCLSDRPSLCLHVSARLLLDGFLWNFIMETFMKISLESPNLVKSSTVHGDVSSSYFCRRY